MKFIVNYKRKNEIKIFENVEQIADFLGNYWMQQVNNLEEGKYYSIALSGGNTPIKIFKYLSENFGNKICWNKIKFFWGDERCVSPNDNDSNFKLANDHLFQNVNISTSNIFRIKGEINPNVEAKEYSEVLKTNLPTENGYPKFDFILLGLGEDGHTASIFPHEIGLFKSPNYCEVANHPISAQKRITITGNIINNAILVVFIAVGKGKAEKVSEILRNKDSAKNYPANLVKPNNGKIIWLLDKDSVEKYFENEETKLKLT